jgi:NADH-quinone oxidoreductase subunit L
VTTALLTAFYMTRMMIMTFHGPNRTGEGERSHLHEAPLNMTIPLGVLAVLSVFGGWINVPGSVRESFFGGFGLLPMSNWLDRWMEPVTGTAQAIRLENVGAYASTAPIGGGHVLWGAIATGLALAVVILAARFIGSAEIRPANESIDPASGIRKLLLEKWYVDEFYDRVIVQPILGLSRFFWKWIDQVLIDGTVNAVGSIARGFGWFGSLFQTGQLNTYAFILTLGALAVLGALIF